MNRFIIGFLIILEISLMVACNRDLPPQDACNFVMSPNLQRVHWANLPMKLYIHSSVPTSAYPALYAAIAEWNGHGTTYFVVAESNTSGPIEANVDGYNTIYWPSSWDGRPTTEEGYTHVTYYGDALIDADIFIDSQQPLSFSGDPGPNGIDLQSLFLHELGHSLGLAHTTDFGSVMYPILQPGQVRRTLGALDLSDLSCGYSTR